jgi:hypothetical protein
MKKLGLGLLAMIAIGSVAFAGTEQYTGKEMKQVAPAPCPEWYADNEWNFSIWGTYLFTSENWPDDRYVESDHAWGGGADLKYFFHRYFGVGIEGFAVDARRAVLDVSGFNLNGVDFVTTDDSGHESRAVGAVLGTFTFRYPFHCSRFSPYTWAGGGAVFGGGERDDIEFGTLNPATGRTPFATSHSDSTTEFIGQFGGGLEIRLTPHIGWMSDFSWNVVDGPSNNFGMVRSGLNFAF